MSEVYRVGNHQPRNIYRNNEYIGVMFSEFDAELVHEPNEFGVEECACGAYEPCHGQCCGVGMCSCSTPQEEPIIQQEGP